MAKRKNKNKLKNKQKQRITDNYSFKEIDTTLEGFNTMRTMYELAKQMGNKIPDLDDTFKKLEIENKKYRNMKRVLNRFNDFFAIKGWIAYESLKFELMEKCVTLAEAGKPDEAEDELIKYYLDKEEVNFHVTRLIHFKEFRPRRNLFLNALDDHSNGRYHASVPLFLMMIDGFVNDIERIGFFADNVDLTVWDTIAAHNSGLGKIHKILNKGRRKTSVEEINLPYRNGILHGRDLGYNNAKVSSKALATLLALRDWADAIKQGKKEETKEYVAPTLEESTEKIMKSLTVREEIKRQKDYMNIEWKRRKIVIGQDIPAKDEVEAYEEDSPERVLIDFLSLLTASNYGKLANLVTRFSKVEESKGKLAGQLREIFDRKKLVDYKLIAIEDNAPAITEIETILEFNVAGGTHFSDKRTFRLIYEDEQGEAVIRGYHKGTWKIMFNFYDIEYKDYL
jgi:hypothetical protein